MSTSPSRAPNRERVAENLIVDLNRSNPRDKWADIAARVRRIGKDSEAKKATIEPRPVCGEAKKRHK